MTAFVRKYVRRAQLVEDNSTEVTFQLPSETARDGYFEKLFEMLENCHQDLGISSFGISDTCLEEIFLKVAEGDDDYTDENKRQKLEEVTDGNLYISISQHACTILTLYYLPYQFSIITCFFSFVCVYYLMKN